MITFFSWFLKKFVACRPIYPQTFSIPHKRGWRRLFADPDQLKASGRTKYAPHLNVKHFINVWVPYRPVFSVREQILPTNIGCVVAIVFRQVNGKGLRLVVRNSAGIDSYHSSVLSNSGSTSFLPLKGYSRCNYAPIPIMFLSIIVI